MQINDKTIWITGASSGIGEAIAKELASKGANLILSARSENKLKALAQQLPNSDKHHVVTLDLSNPEALATTVNEFVKDHPQVDMLVNNGGISQRGTAREIALEVHREVMEINYFGTIALTQALLPTLLANKGKVINIASVAGKVGGQSMSGYAASKHALIGYMDSLRAEETQNGLTVLNVCPGFVKTNISVNSRTADGTQFGEMADSIANGISAEDCAIAVRKAIASDKREIVVGKGISAFAPTLKRWFPGLLMDMAARTNVR